MGRFLLLYMQHFTYGATFVLLGAGVVVPIPQEVVFLVAGYLIERGVMAPTIAFPVCIAGAITGDAIGFHIARKGAARLQSVPLFGRVLSPERFARAQHSLARHEGMTIALARSVAGVRTVVFATAGATGTPFARFLVWDLLGSIPGVALLLGLGYLFSNRLKTITHDVSRAEHWLTLGVLVVTILWCLVTWPHRRRRPALVERDGRGETPRH